MLSKFLTVLLFLQTSTFGRHSDSFSQKSSKINRAPASFVPDDDVIVPPVDHELNFYEKFFLANEEALDPTNLKGRVKIWQENENLAQAHGIDTSINNSPYYVPTQDEKWQLFQRTYFRYIKRQGEDPLKTEGKNVLRNWTASDEIDSIDELEAAFRQENEEARATRRDSILNANKAVAQKTLKNFKFSFQPRLEQGVIIMRAQTPYLEVRAWVGVNGQTELNAQRTFTSTKTRVMVNYFTDSQRFLSSIDQDLSETWKARFTSVSDPDQTAPELANDQRIQLIYNKSF
jgi:hypothetical protein